MSSLVAQVSAGSSVADGVNMFNPVLKNNNKMEEEDLKINQIIYEDT